MRPVLEAARTNSLPDQERIKYFRAMISDIEKESIATANYKDGFDDGMEKGMEKEALAIARRMLAKKKDIAEIVELTGLSEEQVTSLK